MGIKIDNAVFKAWQESFLALMPGFERFDVHHQRYESDERNYKLELVEIFQRELAGRLAQLPADEAGQADVGDKLAALFTCKLASNNAPQNLLNWRQFTPLTKLDAPGRALLACMVAALVNESMPLPERIDTFVSQLPALYQITGEDAARATTHGVTSFFLFLADPQRYIFFKTRLFARILKQVDTRPTLSNGPLSGDDYALILQLANALRDQLSAADWAPRDMIDVQSFIWVCCSENYEEDQPSRATHRVTLTQGAIQNGYVTAGKRNGFFPERHYGGSSDAESAETFSLLLPDGEQIRTDIRADGQSGRLRKRFGALWAKQHVRAGDTVEILRVGENDYQMNLQQASSAEALEIAPTGPAYPLNQILYGPPGTGKTYNTARLAVEICDGSAAENRSELMARYQQLGEAGRIQFVAFHQSFSYEDFVEGIRPRVDEEDKGIAYQCRPGVFRQICSLAREARSATRGGDKIDLGQRRVFKMSLGNTGDDSGAAVFEECLDNNYVLLGYGDDIDFSDCPDAAAIKRRYEERAGPLADRAYCVEAVDYLKNQVSNGDLLLISDGNHKFRAIAEVTGDYQFLPDRPFYAQSRPVRWLTALEESLPINAVFNKILSQRTIYLLDQKAIKREALQGLISPRTPDAAPVPYVLVIDEINRANISKVLGELITLLEADKRLGRENELTLQLPYSGDRFGVPANLHIIGTMNTADRSIALLDTALRRRFHFVEMMPQPAVIPGRGDGCVDGDDGEPINLRHLLRALNERIEYLQDRDHLIGHAYFTQVASQTALEALFRDQLIPLLQEYFYEDWGLLRQVLSGEFIIEQTLDAARLFAAGESVALAEPRLGYRVAGQFNAAMLRRLYAHRLADFERN